MNRKGIFVGLMVLSVFAANGLFAFELWNGLDTDMTKDQLLAKAREVFRFERPVQEMAAAIGRFDYDDDLKNRFPQNLTGVGLFSSLPYLFTTAGYGGRTHPNVELSLSGDRLFAITVSWAHPNDGGYKSGELNALLTRQYGEPRVITREETYRRRVFYVWETPEKLIYLEGLLMLVINKQILR